VEAVSKGAGCDNKQGSRISRTLRYAASLRSAATQDAQMTPQKREVVLLRVLSAYRLTPLSALLRLPTDPDDAAGKLKQ
jgi:hypothetical protein